MKKTSSIVSIIIILCITFLGLSLYKEGTHYMTYFGIRLSKGAFLALMGVFLLLNIFSLKKTQKTEKTFMESREESFSKASDAEKIEGEPCRITLTRLPCVIGMAMGVRVFLNGIEQPVLKNGKSISMQTNIRHNELQISYNADGANRSLNFEATPGGHIRITLKYIGAQLSIDNSAGTAEGPGDEKGVGAR